MCICTASLIVFFHLVLIKCIYDRHRRTLIMSLKHTIKGLSSKETSNSEIRVLIVTAHPDDECMFFAPTIIRLVELKACVHLLCLSEGNYYNQGIQRKQELLNSCAVLGIPASRITVVDHNCKIFSPLAIDKAKIQRKIAVKAVVSNGEDAKGLPILNSQTSPTSIMFAFHNDLFSNAGELPDDPKAEWSISLVSAVIVKHIMAHSFNMVLTFDGRGVSGHANHIAIHKAVSHLAFSGQFLKDCCFLSLVTVGLLRKYLCFLELPISWLLPSCLCCIIGLQDYRQAKAAMLCHRTQLLWFRYLYITFSRYMFINTFKIISQGPKDLKIY